MRSEIIRAEDSGRVEWDDNYFKFCEFHELSMEGGTAVSDFVNCDFLSLDWYSGFFADANFIGCRFTDCVFSGTCFISTRFVQCEFTRCRFKQDNMGGSCNFKDAKAYDCTLSETEGFMADR